MHGRGTQIILEFLENAAASTGELLDIFLTDYHTSYRRARGLDVRRKTMPFPRAVSLQEPQKCYNALSRLRRQGFIERFEKKRWRATRRGIAWLRTLQKRLKRPLPPTGFYVAQQSSEWTIVIFDIPERERWKRRWLRAVLHRLGLKRLQKSVWLGRVKLPVTLLHDLERLRLLPCVEIFAISKSGTLRQV